MRETGPCLVAEREGKSRNPTGEEGENPEKDTGPVGDGSPNSFSGNTG